MTDASHVAAVKRYAGRLLSRSAQALTSPSTTVAYARMLQLVREGRSAGFLRIADVHNVLVLRPDGIGDVIMTGPFLRELRSALPNSRITLVVAPRALNFVERCPYVDRVLTLRIPPANVTVDSWWRPLSRRVAALSLARRHLLREEYELAIVPRWGVDHHEGSVLAYLSGAPSRWGYSEHVSADRQTRNRGYDRFFTQVIADRSVKHEVERNLGLLSALGVNASDDRLETWLSEEDEVFATEILAASGVEQVVALGPGAGDPKRMWPIDRFVQIGHWLTDRGVRLVVLGGSGEEALGDELRRRLTGQVIDLTNKTSLRQSAAVLKRCWFFLGNDAGPMHLAAAAGIPVVEISCHPLGGDDLHANSPTRFGPWGVPHRIARPKVPREGCTRGCRERTPHCILNVHVGSIISVIESLLHETAALGGRSMDLDVSGGSSWCHLNERT